MKIVIVRARWNEFLTNLMLEGALRVLQARKIKFEVVEVPGSFEIPLAIQRALKNKEVAGAVALGVVMKGQTSHNDYIAASCFQGIMREQLESGKPVGCGVLTLDTLEQGIDRCGGKLGNKGAEATEAMLAMLVR
jgi:6,7-dimethyl-8-ribityllumazine synthase